MMLEAVDHSVATRQIRSASDAQRRAYLQDNPYDLLGVKSEDLITERGKDAVGGPVSKPDASFVEPPEKRLVLIS